jgi:TPR repeat protein
LRLAQTYDLGFLALAHLSGARADSSLAVYWYRRAYDLGAPEAKIFLPSLFSN